MKRGEECGDAAIPKYLPRITLVTLREFFVEALLAFFEGAAQGGGCDEKSQQ